MASTTQSSLSRARMMLPTEKHASHFFGLLLALVRRDVTARYRRSMLGPAWAILQPLILMVVFSLIRGIVDIPSSLVPEQWRALYGLNPMAGVVEGFRWALLGKEPPGPLMAVSIVVVVLLLIGGLYYFRRMEKTFADVV